MIRMLDIHNAVATLLREKTGFETYSNEVKEDPALPCFFCAVTERPGTAQNAEVLHREVDVTLNFLPEVDETGTRKEKDGARMHTLLGAVFGNVLHVGDRFLTVRQQAKDFGGENSDIPLFSFTLDFFDDYIFDDSEEQPADSMIEQISAAVRLGSNET